jgi:asparagine synthase (glutamine-hydrolysing)
MHAMQAHRGPDGEGALLLDSEGHPRRLSRLPTPGEWAAWRPSLGLAYRRLAIQDLTPAGDQPIAGPSERQWILHNGEIYNHHELRTELGALGHRFRGRSDSEVALAAYREWGLGCFPRFNGMWSILILDLDRGVLVGSRDRLGIKPLYWAQDGGCLAIASEPQAVASALWPRPRVAPGRLVSFLRGLPATAPDETFFAGVRAVAAGTTFELAVDEGNPATPEPRRFWRLECARDPAVRSWDDVVDQYGELLGDAVRLRMRADVPVGCLLSGGLDTSLIAVTMARLAGQAHRVNAFSIVYTDPAMSEAPYILAVAGHAGLVSHRYVLSPDEAWDSVDAVVRCQGEPLLGQDLIAQYQAYRTGRAQGTVVILDGQGADELLAGLPTYAARYHVQLLASLRWGSLVGELTATARREGRSVWAVARAQLGGPLQNTLRARFGGRRYAWLRNGVPEPPSRAPSPDEPCADGALLNRYLFRLVRRTNLPAVLAYVDRAAMAHGVEARVPYLDHRLVELCFALPVEYKVSQGERKRVLLALARRHLPALAANRTDKRRFISRSDWLPLHTRSGALHDDVRSSALTDLPWIHRGRLASFVDGFCAGRHRDAQAVWRLHTVARWAAQFNVRA